MTRAQLLRRGLIVGGLLGFSELPERWLIDAPDPVPFALQLPVAEAPGHWVYHASGYTDLAWWDRGGSEMGWQLQDASEDARRDAERQILASGGSYQYGGDAFVTEMMQ